CDAVAVPVVLTTCLITFSVGGAGGTNSYAPISTPPPCGLVTPRWSTFGAPAVVPGSIAGLPASNASFSVEPPFSSHDPSFGSTLDTPATPQWPMLVVAELREPPLQSLLAPLPLLQRITFSRLIVPPVSSIPAPLPLIVSLTSEAVVAPLLST